MLLETQQSLPRVWDDLCYVNGKWAMWRKILLQRQNTILLEQLRVCEIAKLGGLAIGIVDIDIQGSPWAVQEVFGLESRQEGGEQELGEDEDYDLQSIQPLKIVMLVIGTQGDVQPFIGIGRKWQVLKIFSPSTTTCVFIGVCANAYKFHPRYRPLHVLY
jgi:hypothetical protein